MARRWSSGFELNTTTEFTTATGVSISSSTPRTGTYCGLCSITSGTKKYFHTYFSAGEDIGFYYRVYLRVGTRPSAETSIIGACAVVSFTVTPLVWITIDNSGLLRLYDEDGQIGAASSVLSNSTYYCIELFTDTSGAAGTHDVAARINGIEFASATDRSISDQLIYFMVGGNLFAEAISSGSFRFDDMALNDDTGTEQNSYAGEGSIIHLRPNATGDSDDWARGGTDSGSNWGQVDEVTPNDATDYIQSNHTLNETDDYNIGNTSISGQVIRLLQVGAKTRADASPDASDTAVLRIKASSGGAVQEGTGITNYGTSWRFQGLATNRNYKLTSYFKPSTSDRWTVSDVNSAQIGVRVSVVNTNKHQITTIWALVEYRPILTAILTDPIVVISLLNRYLAKKAFLETIVIVVNAFKRQTSRTYGEVIKIIGGMYRGYSKVYTGIVVVVAVYSDLFQAGRLFVERLIIVPTLIRRIYGSIWTRGSRAVSNFIRGGRPPC